MDAAYNKGYQMMDCLLTPIVNFIIYNGALSDAPLSIRKIFFPHPGAWHVFPSRSNTLFLNAAGMLLPFFLLLL